MISLQIEWPTVWKRHYSMCKNSYRASSPNDYLCFPKLWSLHQVGWKPFARGFGQYWGLKTLQVYKYTSQTNVSARLATALTSCWMHTSFSIYFSQKRQPFLLILSSPRSYPSTQVTLSVYARSLPLVLSRLAGPLNWKQAVRGLSVWG